MEKKLVFVSLWLLAIPMVMGERIRRVPVPVECRNLEDCNNLWRHGEAYSCSEGKCTCHLQAVFDSVNKKCTCKPGFKKIGNECIGDAQVPPPVNGTSRTLASCTSDSQCQEKARCVLNVCECEEDYAMIANKCRKVANTVGELCEYHEQCKKKLGGYSECAATKCVCISTGVSVQGNSTCMAKKVLGEECSYEEQCNYVQHGTCSDKMCRCDPGFVEFENTCLPVVDKYNLDCHEHLQCRNGKLGYGSICKGIDNEDKKKCLCEAEFFYQSSVQQCLYARGLEDACDRKNNDCFLPADGDKQNIECKNAVCVCKKGFIPSEDKKRCENAGVVTKMSFFVMAMLLLTNAIRW